VETLTSHKPMPLGPFCHSYA